MPNTVLDSVQYYVCVWCSGRYFGLLIIRLRTTICGSPPNILFVVRKRVSTQFRFQHSKRIVVRCGARARSSRDESGVSYPKPETMCCGCETRARKVNSVQHVSVGVPWVCLCVYILRSVVRTSHRLVRSLSTLWRRAAYDKCIYMHIVHVTYSKYSCLCMQKTDLYDWQSYHECVSVCVLFVWNIALLLCRHTKHWQPHEWLWKTRSHNVCGHHDDEHHSHSHHSEFWYCNMYIRMCSTPFAVPPICLGASRDLAVGSDASAIRARSAN